MADIFPKINLRTYDPSVESFIDSTARGCIATGAGNYIGAGCLGVNLIGCTNCLVSGEVSNVTLINSQDIVINSSDVLYSNNLIVNSNLSAQIYSFDQSITSALVLGLFTTPFELVAPVVDYAIQLLSMSCTVIFNTTAYATNLDLRAITDTATLYQMQIVNALNANATRTLNGVADSFGALAGSTQLINNKGLNAIVPGGNPIAGDSNIVVKGTYKLIAL